MRKPQDLVRRRDRPAEGGSRPEPDLRPEARTPGMVEVRAGEAGDAAQAVSDAVQMVGEAALRHGIGIMITDVGDGNYVVRAHPAVPHGLVREQRG